MVVFCSAFYPKKQEEIYQSYFDFFPFSLSDFQKHSIEAIVSGNHSLVCAPTGSGKTISAEFAIRYFTGMGKRVIYTSPLKALSNEKFYDFTKKFPGVSFGVLTGDIKVNPEAQVLIMTAEILLNTLYSKHSVQSQNQGSQGSQGSQGQNPVSPLSFEMDFEKELGCVVMDEIHFINDEARGKVWEETIMILPQHIQMIMLSATLDAPEKFAFWIENRGYKGGATQCVAPNPATSTKQVFLSSTNYRIVPLTHYSFITTNNGIFKAVKKDEALVKEIKDIINKPLEIQSSQGVFNDTNYYKIKKMLHLFQDKNIYIKRQHVIDEVCKYMFDNNMLPAVLFILSRKQIDIIAKEITANLLEDDSKVPYIVRRECEQIIRKLPNYEEYLHLPEYNQMVQLLEKGIGTHHSGVLPILREITEILFSKGYIKLLLATETFSVGLNMPIKTTVFTSLMKFDGTENRFFYSHEYTQCAGRAGRRGIDTVGNVIHLNNLFRSQVELKDYKLVMQGKPQTLVSKFKVSYNLLLNLINIGDSNLSKFVERSMIHDEIDNEMGVIWRDITKLENEMMNLEMVLSSLKTPRDVIEQYLNVYHEAKLAVNKKKKDAERKVINLTQNHISIERDSHQLIKWREKQKELDCLKRDYENVKQYMNHNVLVLLDFLTKQGFVLSESGGMPFSLTLKGFIANHLREVNCVVFADLIFAGHLNRLSAKQLICLFSCFTNIVVSDELKSIQPCSKDMNVISCLQRTKTSLDMIQDFEVGAKINSVVDMNIHYELLDFIGEWCDCLCVENCKFLLQRLEKEKEIFLGEFIKAILKINTISSEMEKVAESIGNMELLSKLKEIPVLTLKYVATNQSLYV
jgi:superfamily II RNA helicase